MPNHCANRVIINGDSKVLQQVKDYVTTLQNEKMNHFDVDKILPMPKEMEGIISGCSEIDGVRCNLWREKRVGDKIEREAIPLQELLEMERKYGTASWYDWCCANWGTKWGTYDTFVESDEPEELVIFYQTAWSPLSTKIFEILTDKFDIRVEVQFAERGCNFAGTQRFVEGVLVEDESVDTERDDLWQKVDEGGNPLPDDEEDYWDVEWQGEEKYTDLFARSG